MRLLNVILSTLTVTLLAVVIWRVEAVGSIGPNRLGSGQHIESGATKTERWLIYEHGLWRIEDVEACIARHLEAERRLQNAMDRK